MEVRFEPVTGCHRQFSIKATFPFCGPKKISLLSPPCPVMSIAEPLYHPILRFPANDRKWKRDGVMIREEEGGGAVLRGSPTFREVPIQPQRKGQNTEKSDQVT